MNSVATIQSSKWEMVKHKLHPLVVSGMQWNKLLFKENPKKPYTGPKLFNQFTKPIDLLEKLYDINETGPRHMHICAKDINTDALIKYLYLNAVLHCNIQQSEILYVAIVGGHL